MDVRSAPGIIGQAGHRVEEIPELVEDTDDDEMPALVGPPFLVETLDARSAPRMLGQALAGHSVEDIPELVEDTVADDDEMPALVGPPFPVWLLGPADAAPGPMQLRVLRGPCRSPAWGFAKPGRQGWQRPAWG